MAYRMPKHLILKEQLAVLAYALNRLAPVQGDRARRNARAGVSAAVKALWREIDLRYAAPPRRVTPRATYANLTPAQAAVHKKRKLRTQGYTEVTEPRGQSGLLPSIIKACATAGVLVKTLDVDTIQQALFVPDWVLVIGPDPAKLRRARTDIQYRKALCTEKTLLAQVAQSAQK